MSARSRRSTTLNVYYLLQYPLRSTASDYLYSFRRYGRGNQLYLNLAVREVPAWVRRAPIDLVVFQTAIFSTRSDPSLFESIFERAAPLKGVGAVRVGLPQDEYFGLEQLNRFINEFEIDHLFTLPPESEWPKIYREVDRSRVRIERALSGYLADHTRRRIDGIVKRTRERPIDIGYRAWRGAPWLGRHGMLKGELGEVVREAAPRHGLRTDISSDDSAVLLGDDWFRFLASCKYTLGCEAGASMLDWDGSIRERTERYLAEHPGASFEEVEAACFPGEDGGVDCFAIGPRHIEACATRTCQVLVEGDYHGVLKPWKHYIPIRRDLSNLDDVLELIRRDELREELTERAYRDVVASGRHSYRSFVQRVESVDPGPPVASRRQGAAMALRRPQNRVFDAFSWARVIYRVRVFPRWYPVKVRLVQFRQRRLTPLAPYLPHRLLPAVWRRLVRAARGEG